MKVSTSYKCQEVFNGWAGHKNNPLNVKMTFQNRRSFALTFIRLCDVLFEDEKSKKLKIEENCLN